MPVNASPTSHHRAEALRARAARLLQRAQRLHPAGSAVPGHFAALADPDPDGGSDPLAAMVDALPADLVLVDRAGAILAGNVPGLGLAPPPVPGASFVEHYLGQDGVVPPAAWEAADGVAALLAGRCDGLRIDFPWPDPDAGLWLRLVGRLRPADGSAVLVRMDITESHESQEAVRRSEEKYRLLFRRNPHPMWVYDAETLRFLEVNGRAIERYGWSERQFQAMTIADIRPPAERERLAGFDRQRGEGMLSCGVWRHLTRGGEELLAEVHADDISFAGRPARIVMAVDVTERVRLEEQLAQSRRLEALGQLTGGVAHDFNNLLTVIQGNAELLCEAIGDDRPDLRELAGMIATAGDLGGQLTGRLLAFGRRQPLAPQPVDAAALLEGMLPLLRRSLGRDIEVEVTGQAPVWRALADPGQLENAVLNLCVNARDAMPDGGRVLLEAAELTLDAEAAAGYPDIQPGDYVVVKVTDTGCGIAAADLPRIFEPFFTTKPRGHGTGLGLSMVWGFVRQSRGHVSVYSEPGAGTTVRMFLPRCDAGSGVPCGDPAAQPQGAPVQGAGECVLLVEDDDLVRAYAREQLLALGYRVRVATCGSEALEVLEREPGIDVLLTDVVMPGGMNGRQLAEAARRLRPDLPVLFASGFPGNALSRNGRIEAGVFLLAKPYRRAELARRLRQVLDARAVDGVSA